MPDFTQYASSDTHGASSAHQRTQPGTHRLPARLPLPAAGPRRSSVITTLAASNTLTPKPNPAQSSVGISPSTMKPPSKLATMGSVIACGSTVSAERFHQPARGKKVGTKLFDNSSSALPQIPTSGFFISIPSRSSTMPDQSPQ